MSLLAELQHVRRSASMNLDDARRAVEISFLEAQKQWGDKVDELKSALLVSTLLALNLIEILI